MAVTIDGTNGITTPDVDSGPVSGTNFSYTGTLTGGTGVVNLGSGQFVKDASGNVGIGSSSPTEKLQVNGNILAGAGGQIMTSSGAAQYGARTANSVLFLTNNSEVMRIDSSGNLLVNASSSFGSGSVQANAIGSGGAIASKNSEWSTYTQYIWNATTTDNSRFVSFGTQGTYTERGSIDYNRGSNVTRFITTSDATLKNIIGDHNGQRSTEILSTTRIREFAWKADSDQKPQIGVIAQELHETFKGAVSVGGENAQGDYTPWGVDKTAFTFHLVAGWQAHEKMIQELKAINDAQAQTIESLTARVAALEGQA